MPQVVCLSNEEWKPIPGYEGLYSVSNMGRVKSHERVSAINHRKSDERIMCLTDKNGYKEIRLYKHGKRPTYQVHRLVLLAFVGSSTLKCNHKNAIKSDNRLINLEYVTQKDNVLHASSLGLMKHVNAKRKRVPVERISIEDGTRKVFKSFLEAGLSIGKKSSHIQDAAAGRIKTAYGFIWRRI